MTLQTLGFAVVDVIDGREKRVSPRYTARSAAEHFCELYRKQGHPDAFVSDVVGQEVFKPRKAGAKKK